MMQSLSIEKILKYNKKKPINAADSMLYILKTTAQEMNFSDMSELDSDTGGISVAVDYSKLMNRFIRDGNKHMADIVPTFDKVLLQVMRHIQQYKRGGFKNYIPSSNFLEVMKQISLDVPIKVLDRDMKLYFDISGRIKDDDGIPALWVAVSTEERLGKRYLGVTMYSSDNAPRHTMIRLEGERISDIYNKLLDTRFVNGSVIENEVDYMKAPFTQIIQELLQTEDVAVIIDAVHTCVKTRGIKDGSSYTRTSAILGRYKAQEARAELFSALPQLKLV